MSDEKSNEEVQKKKYEKPSIESEDLNIYGAVCNGTTRGGRKATADINPPPICNVSKLNS